MSARSGSRRMAGTLAGCGKSTPWVAGPGAPVDGSCAAPSDHARLLVRRGGGLVQALLVVLAQLDLFLVLAPQLGCGGVLLVALLLDRLELGEHLVGVGLRLLAQGVLAGLVGLGLLQLLALVRQARLGGGQGGLGLALGLLPTAQLLAGLAEGELALA